MKTRNIQASLTHLLKWLATASIMASALYISVVVESALLIWPFVGFLAGHILWTLFAYWMAEWPLLALNASFILLDAYAIWLRL